MKKKVLTPLTAVEYGEITVKDPALLERINAIAERYLSIPVEDAFYEMRKAAGVDTRGGRTLINGESWFEKGGIVLGQWLQAFSRFYAATGDERFRQRVREYIDALREVQRIVPDCYICSTTYMAEKVFHGLMDAVEYCGFDDAYDLCRDLLDNFRKIPAIANAKCRLGDNGGSPDETYREIEWYTLSEALYRFADMSIDRGVSEVYISELEHFAKKFEYTEFWDIFLNDQNLFDYSPKAGQNSDFFHAYSHVNSFNSAAYLYLRTGDDYYLEAIKKFMNFMEETQMVATGGYGTYLEWLLPKNRIIDALINKCCNFENQCNTYATLRLNRFLATATGHIRYGRISELLYYNSFLASLETDAQGHAFYYSDYGAKGGCKWLNPISWTCCSGTRPLVALEVMKNIYFRGDDDSLYVNLFVASQIHCKNATIELEGDYTKDGKILIRCIPQAGAAAGQTVHVRKPAYLAEKPLIIGADFTETDEEYCITFGAEGTQTVTIAFALPIYSKDISDGGIGVRAYLHGPLVLAAEGKEIHPTVEASVLKQQEDGTFRAEDDVFKPYTDYIQDEEYRMHFVLEE